MFFSEPSDFFFFTGQEINLKGVNIQPFILFYFIFWKCKFFMTEKKGQ